MTNPGPHYLLDVNVLLAAIWVNHPLHGRAFAWLSGKRVMLCPLSELGFLRISTNQKVFNVAMERARQLLDQFAKDRAVERIADDLAALDSHSKKSEQVTDHYLGDLALKHGARLATLDQNLRHSAVEAIS